MQIYKKIPNYKQFGIKTNIITIIVHFDKKTSNLS